MRMMLIDVKSESPNWSIVDIEPELAVYYDLLKCDIIDMPLYTVNGVWFAVICDDDGAIIDDPILAGANPYNQPLFGNLLICGIRESEDGLVECSLTDDGQAILEARMCAHIQENGVFPFLDLRP